MRSMQASTSALGSLCGEAHTLRVRLVQIEADHRRCQDPALCGRLQGECDQLIMRLAELGRIASWLESSPLVVDRLSLALFKELCGRPLSCC